MKNAFVYVTLLVVSSLAAAESAWDYDSCMEGMSRQFTCSINGKKISVDLEASSAKMSYKVPDVSGEKIYGIFIGNIDGGELYISCEDGGTLEKVRFEILKKLKVR